MFREAVARALRSRGHTVSTAASLDGALLCASSRRPEFLLVDLKLGKESGLDVLTAVRTRVPLIRAVVHTGSRSATVRTEALQRGAVRFLPKPATPDEILAALLGTRVVE